MVIDFGATFSVNTNQNWSQLVEFSGLNDNFSLSQQFENREFSFEKEQIFVISKN